MALDVVAFRKEPYEYRIRTVEGVCDALTSPAFPAGTPETTMAEDSALRPIPSTRPMSWHSTAGKPTRKLPAYKYRRNG